MTGIKNLFHELRRRRVFRMTAVYIIASWVILPNHFPDPLLPIW